MNKETAMPLDTPQARIAELARYYRRHLIEDVIGFWTPRTGDPDYPGFIVGFDRCGRLTDARKNNWCQGRQTWTFSALCNKLERRDEWLQLASRGRDFLVTHGYAGSGRWYYLHNRDGSVAVDTLSWFTDASALIGLAEYAIASGDQTDVPLITEAFRVLETNLRTPGFDQYHHHPLDGAFIWHGPYMIALNVAQVLRPLLGPEVVAGLADLCLDRILNAFARDEEQMIFEVLNYDYTRVDSDVGVRVNPGHAMESAWFCMEEALYRDNPDLLERAGRFCRSAFEKGYDHEFGGILAFTDYEGNPPPGVDDVANVWGERWDDKVWWVHSEALYALALAGIALQDQQFFDRFLDLHDYCRRFFWDREYGEWYAYLNRDNTPRETNKGNWIKCAYHIPRNLLKLTLLLEQQSRSAT